MSVRDLTILGCSSQQPTRLRNHGAYLLRWNGEGLLFDPGEGTQRQFIFANIAPTCVTRIFVSHFHGDHCLGLGSMLMRLNLDKVTHPIHVYYPASGKRYFDALRYGTIYHEQIQVVEHPIRGPGLVEAAGPFRIEAFALEHGVDNYAYRITEPDQLRFDQSKLQALGLRGPIVGELQRQGRVSQGDRVIDLEEVSHVRPGDTFAIALDTRPCRNLVEVSRDARLFLCESTYLDSERDLARHHRHLTATQAAQAARDAGAHHLVLTHFSARYTNLNPFLEEARAIFPNTDVADDMKVFPFSKGGE